MHSAAISRLSASPTPGNAPRHPNAARGVRETYTKAVILQADTSSIRALWLRAPQVRGTQTAALHRFCRSPPDLKPWVNNFLSDLRD